MRRARDRPRRRTLGVAGVLATLLGDLPLASVDPAPGSTGSSRRWPGRVGPLFVVTGRRGGVSGPDLRRAATVDLAIAAFGARAALGRGPARAARFRGDSIARQYRMTGGHIRLVAPAADAAARSGRTHGTRQCRGGRRCPRAAAPSLRRHRDPGGHAGFVGRCRRRARDNARPQPGRGPLPPPRARWRAAVGAGARTRARPACARCSAGRAAPARPSPPARWRRGSALDLYRVDLATVVNKYLGETEKNLDRLFDARRGDRRRRCCSTRATPDDAAHLGASRRTTATPTSRPTSCCSGSSRSRASSWSPPTPRTASTARSSAGWTSSSTSLRPAGRALVARGSCTCLRGHGVATDVHGRRSPRTVR